MAGRGVYQFIKTTSNINNSIICSGSIASVNNCIGTNFIYFSQATQIYNLNKYCNNSAQNHVVSRT